ncbi:MAG: hypothetical protein DRN96_02740 [Thermoproteota archaeon]|nr:MAG: hypothetical protein DRN96_02740 [Candidatus Korarchaeota archaeon]
MTPLRRICISVRAESQEEALARVQKAQVYKPLLVEVRLDYMAPSEAKLAARRAAGKHSNILLTYRRWLEGGARRMAEEERAKLLLELIEAKPMAVDIELHTLEERRELADRAREEGVLLVASWHSSYTPGARELENIARRELELAWVAKVVPRAGRAADNLEVLKLYRRVAGRLVAFCSGSMGVLSRVLCLMAGAPYTYVCLPGEATAEGQLTAGELIELMEAAGVEGFLLDR